MKIVFINDMNAAHANKYSDRQTARVGHKGQLKKNEKEFETYTCKRKCSQINLSILYNVIKYANFI